MGLLVPEILVFKEVVRELQLISKKERKTVESYLNKFTNMPIAHETLLDIPDKIDPFYFAKDITPSLYGVLKKPERGQIYLLLSIGQKEKAFEWARNHRCKINSYTGAIQVSGTLSESQKRKYIPDPFVKGILSEQDDKNLRRLGVPEDLITWVKNLAKPEDLFTVYHSLPEQVYEALFRLANGAPIDVLLNEHREDILPMIVDIEDYDAAAKNYWTLQAFVRSGDQSFNEALNSPLDAWRVFLHPSQRTIVEKTWNGPARVLGEAGTGKTIVVLHRAKVLVEKFFTQPDDRVLVTTFGRNLAFDIKARLSEITNPDAFARLDVVNLDQWLSGTLRTLEPHLKLLYDDSKRRSFWKQSMEKVESTLSLSFISEEFERVILVQGIPTEEEYLKASRAGRGKAIKEQTKKDAWVVFQAYRTILHDENYVEPSDAMRIVRERIENGEWSSPYCSVVADEAQDLGMQALKLLRALAGADHPNDVFISGDAHQRIYPRKTSLSKCGINIRGRSRKLKLSYRTPEEIRSFAIRLLEGLPIDDLDDQLDISNETIALRKGTKPDILNFKTLNEEVSSIAERLKQIPKDSLKDSCLVVRTSKQVRDYEQQFKNLGIATYVLPRQNNEDRTKDGLRIATMHRVKGLEFEHMFLAGVNKGIIPLGEKPITEEADIQERCLFYVALTRAKMSVSISSYGETSVYLM